MKNEAIRKIKLITVSKKLLFLMHVCRRVPGPIHKNGDDCGVRNVELSGERLWLLWFKIFVPWQTVLLASCVSQNISC